MTTEDIIIHIFYHVDNAVGAQRKEPCAKLYPSEVVTIGILFALKSGSFAVNHLAPHLLTNLLLDTLKASAPARIINVSSNAHTSGKIEFDNLQGERAYGFQTYGNSKLANILFTVELAHRLEATEVTVNALHPGLVATSFGKNTGRAIAALFGIIAPLVALPPAKGAGTSIYLASSPTVDGITGKYCYRWQVIPAAPQAIDMVVARKLWDVSAEMVHLQDSVPVLT